MIKFVPYEVNTGMENMRLDSELLDYAIKNQMDYPIFRLYGWAPKCISLGKNQNSEFLNKQLLKHNGIDMVRRLTGGRALLHDDEVTYSYICPVSYLKNGANVVQSYMEISQFLIDKFREIDIELEFGSSKKIDTKFDYCMLISTGADLCCRGKKLIGSAQCRKNGYILQHGSILYDYDKELLEKIFHEKVDTSTITTVKEINPKLTKKSIVNLLTLC